MKSALLVDTTSIFAFQQHLREHSFNITGNPNYRALVEALRKGRQHITYVHQIAFVSVDPDNEGQRKFCTFLENNKFMVDAADYRDAFILPDRSSPYQRLSTRLTYACGLLASKVKSYVVVTDAYDCYYPLSDLASTRDCDVTLAFFRTGLEARWQRAGLFEPDSAIKFMDLDLDAGQIIGADIAAARSISKSGLGQLKL